MATSPDWTPEEDEWLRECYPLCGNRELAEFKALDGWPRDEQSIARRARTLGIRKDPSRGYRKPMPHNVWTDEMQEWARGYIPGHSWREVSDECNRRFGKPLTKTMVNNLKRLVGVKSGTVGGRFERGHEPANKGRTWDEYLPPETQERCRATTFKTGVLNGVARERDRGLLGERLTKDGYREVRVDPRGERRTMERWIPLGAFNWMAANGREWPDGCRCVHADRDIANDAADNIVPVPKELWPLVNGANSSALPWHDRETLEAAMISARISLRRSELARQWRIAEGRPWACDVGRDSSPATRKVD